MPGPSRSCLACIAVVSACGFTAPTQSGTSNPAVDSSVDVYIPEATICGALMAECIGSNSKLRKCETVGMLPIDYDCDWGCSMTGGAHCAKLQPSGGFVTAADLDPNAMLQNITIEANGITIDTVTGAISGGIRPAGPGPMNGIDFVVRGNTGVFRFKRLIVTGTSLQFVGTNAVALVSITDMSISAVLDLQGPCDTVKGGPGGGSGGAKNSDGQGSGKGRAGYGSDNTCAGGGGGGNGGDGGRSGVVTDNKGGKFGTELIPLLVGGGGGGGGAAGAGAEGGGGGGAIQLVANKRITIAAPGGIHAGGCGGKAAAACGGGGGAGGTILIEAPVIDFMASKLAVNGGGGGGGNAGNAGEKAQLSNSKANGGAGGTGGPNKGGNGGDGGDDNTANGSAGGLNSRCGGGGGGVGRMRFNTLSGGILTSGAFLFSPAISTANQTTVTRGVTPVL